jgi:Mg2+-importing ATPase
MVKTLALAPPETEFERGLRKFGMLLLSVMLVIVFMVLTVKIALHHPTIETLLFAMALAVGLSPELLPAVLTITLARGARKMARHGVIVKRLNSIENLGSMDVLCTDKTGTLTRGVVQLDRALDLAGQPDAAVLQLAYLNSDLQKGLANALDDAIKARGDQAGLDSLRFRKLDEVPYDFVRKSLSIVVDQGDGTQAVMITKGALQNVLDACDRSQAGAAVKPLDDSLRRQIQQQYMAWSEQGFRVLGVAQKPAEAGNRYTRMDERGMIFAGFLLFFDPPEVGVGQTLDGLQRLGVQLKIITGDNQFVARHVAQAVGIETDRIITGSELAMMKDEALWHLAPKTTLFAEVDPNQKERIITALQKTGHVVGYLGDGINDAPALHAADVGISVDQAVDVAKEAADFVLLEHDLEVLRQGIDEGRHAFANTIKYIFITTSANFGNMISMALASLFLPFLPLLAHQVLLNNFLSDIPAMGIAGDNVDRDWENTPHRWDIRLIRNFMLTFGLLSTAFDLVTFAVLLLFAGGSAQLFRTGWFLESLLTELLILFVIRTCKSFYKSRAASFLVWSAAVVAALALALPYIWLGRMFGFVPLPASIMLAIIGITLSYVLVSELTKKIFFRRIGGIRE